MQKICHQTYLTFFFSNETEIRGMCKWGSLLVGLTLMPHHENRPRLYKTRSSWAVVNKSQVMWPLMTPPRKEIRHEYIRLNIMLSRDDAFRHEGNRWSHCTNYLRLFTTRRQSWATFAVWHSHQAWNSFDLFETGDCVRNARNHETSIRGWSNVGQPVCVTFAVWHSH